MAGDGALVSVIYACPASPRAVREAVASMRAQSCTDWELLVVGSHDQRGDVFNGVDPRVRVLQGDEEGQAAALNAGLEAARGELVTFLEGADAMGVAALDRRVQALRSSPGDLVYCRAEFTGPDFQPLGFADVGGKVLTFADVHAGSLVLSSVMGRRDLLGCDAVDQSCGEAAAWAYLARLLRRGVRIRRVDDCEVLHRLRPGVPAPHALLEAEQHRLAVLDLVYGIDNGCPDAAAEWRQGLTTPQQAAVRTRRLAGLVTQLLLADDADTLDAAVDLVPSESLDVADGLRATVYRAVAAAIACRLADAPAELRRRADTIAALADGVDLVDRIPELAAALARTGLPLATNRPLISTETGTEPAQTEVVIGPFQRNEARMREDQLVRALLVNDKGVPGRMVDVGAHRGSTLSGFCSEGWDVRAFEPDPENRAALEKRVKAHWNLSIDPRAVSDRSGEHVQFFKTEESSGASSLTAFTDSHEAAVTVETVTLRDALGRSARRHIHFLKTDTEGHDLPVLRGFPWDCNRPDVVLCEFEDNKTKHLGYATDDLAGFLQGQGYHVFVSEWHPIIRYGIPHDFKAFYRFAPGQVPATAWGNLIAVGSAAAAEAMSELARQGIGLERGAQEPTSAPKPDRQPATRIGEAAPPTGGVVARATVQASRLGQTAARGVRLFASPSGAVLAVAIGLLLLGFIGVGPWRLFGILGVAALGVFLPYKFANQHERTAARLATLADEVSGLGNRIETAPERQKHSIAAGEETASLREELRTLRITLAAAIAREDPVGGGAVDPERERKSS